jgi:antigen flippase
MRNQIIVSCQNALQSVTQREGLVVATFLGTATAFRMLLAFVSVKLIALAIGPAGLGLLGQYYSLIYIATALAGGGIATALPVYMSRRREGSESLCRSDALGYAIGFSVALSGLYAIGAMPIAIAFLKPDGWVYVLGLGAIQLGLAYSNFKSALLAYFGRQRELALCNVYSSVLSALIICAGCAVGSESAVIFSVVFSNLAPALVFRTRGRSGANQRDAVTKPSRAIVQSLLPYAGLSLVSVCGMPLAYMIARSWLSGTEGWSAVGQWQAVARLSDAYFQFLLVFLTSYVYPKLVAEGALPAQVKFALRTMQYLGPIMLATGIAIYLCRYVLINALFSEKFIDSGELFLPQIIGDILKGSAYLFGYVVLAAGKKALSIFLEIFQALCFLVISYGIGLHMGPSGMSWTYCATYVIYFLLVLSIVIRIARSERA